MTGDVLRSPDYDGCVLASGGPGTASSLIGTYAPAPRTVRGFPCGTSSHHRDALTLSAF